MKNILHITNELNKVDGVTNHVYTLLKSLSAVYDGKIFILAGGGNHTDVFCGTGIKTVIDTTLNHKNRNLRNFAAAINFVRKFIKDNSIGIVHSHNHYAANIARYAAGVSGALTVQTNHGLFPDRGRLKLFNAGFHIALNSRIYGHLKDSGIPAGRMRLIKPGIDFVFQNVRKERNTFLAASRFSKEKGLDKYIVAANSIEKKYPGKYNFYLCGEGVEESSLNNLNSEKGRAVQFVDDYKKYLAQSEFFVFPSEAKEGMPTVILEAVFSGCLVLTSDYGGVSDIFPKPFDELIFKAGDSDELEKSMMYASDNSEALKTRYANHRDKVIAGYSVENMVREHLELYKEILD